MMWGCGVFQVSDLSEPILPETPNFKWYEALELRHWGMYCFPDNDFIFANIEATAQVMQKIRALLKRPIEVTSWYRPERYNMEIGGSKRSHHRMGMAVDFKVDGMTAGQVRERLKPRLEYWDIRMQNSNTRYIHIDIGEVKWKRFFK
jgi:hypothetical protein